MKVIFATLRWTTWSKSTRGSANDNPPVAAEMVARIRDRISLLEIDALAHMGRPGLVAGTRELIEYPYIIVYRVTDQRHEVEVLAIFHGAQDR
jgi:plasmid stabilization system protein ParE